MLKEYFTVLIEDKVGNEEVVVVESQNEEEAEKIACKYAEDSMWGAGDWESTTIHKGFLTVLKKNNKIVSEIRF